SCRPRRSSSTCARSIASSTFTPGPSSSRRSRLSRTPPRRPASASVLLGPQEFVHKLDSGSAFPHGRGDTLGVPEELPHHRAVRLAPCHLLEALPGASRRDAGKQ